MPASDANPIIVQSDRSVLLEAHSPRFLEARDFLGRFAELIKSPEHIHTYRITPLSLWNAAASGMAVEEVVGILQEYSKYPLPNNVVRDIFEYASRYGKLKLLRRDGLVLVSPDEDLIDEICQLKTLGEYLLGREDKRTVRIRPERRGHVKQALLRVGYPVEDLAGYAEGAPLAVHLRDKARSGTPFALRPYQREAVDAFYAGGTEFGGTGVVALPCGAGKTIVGMGAMARVRAQTLILVTSIVAARQWRDELLDKTTLSQDDIGEYSGETKDQKPVTVATYQILTWRASKTDVFPHFQVFYARNWGLIIYDEVHLLPAPVFRITAELQAKRRLGLTATLVREDGLEEDVFSLIGPKRYDVPWKTLESQGWIAKALCTEIRIPFSPAAASAYVEAGQRQRFRVAAENEAKLPVMRELLCRHPHESVIIIGQYLDQLRNTARLLNAPLITGSTKTEDRQRLYAQFRRKEIPVLLVSKVGNFAIDLPNASVLIQISGTFGSRQEEAQRLGRILRPKTDGCQAHFYTLVTRDSREQHFAQNRQLFLTEQGYGYQILDAEDVLKLPSNGPRRWEPSPPNAHSLSERR